jgi:ATP-dependent Clp protease ATP-binding subunit ClpC
VHVPPLTDRETLPVLLGCIRDLESDYGGDWPVRFAPDALEILLQTIQRFMAHEAFPGKAVRMLRRVAAGYGVVRAGARRYEIPQVYQTLRQQTGLPDFILGNAAPRPREDIRRDLTQMVAGQPEAIDAVTDCVLTMQQTLQDPEKPLATYLFVGPTGVGKTETAKALAKYLFGSADRIVRFDMSEMSSSASITRLTGHPGAPDGELTTALRTQPFCVILLDEIEKAHPRVFDALLQLMGEGRLTDAAGRTADARQAVIILTSNLGVREAAARAGFGREDPGSAQAHYTQAARRFFRPEFFNRLDRVVAFRSLDPAALRIVVEHALQELLSRRGVRRSNVLVDVEPQLLDLLVEQAYDPRFGARPLKRALERKLTVPLAHHLVRRQSNDLALVELYRKHDDMGLAVRLLREAPSIVEGEKSTDEWTYGEMMTALAETRERIHALAVSPHVLKLAEQRAQALAAAAGGSADGHAGFSAGMDLLDRMVSLQEELRDLDDLEATEVQFGEEIDGSSKEEIRAYFHARDRGRGKGGLRPRPGYRDVPMPMNPEVVLRKLRPRVVSLRDQVEVLAHQLDCAAARGDDRWTLLVECVGEWAREGLDHAAMVMPYTITRWTRFDEMSSPDQPELMWRAQPYYMANARVRRSCFLVEGAGVAELLRPLAGFVLVEVLRDGAPRLVPVKVEVFPGDGPDAVRARDERVAADRDARRSGNDGASAPAELVARQKTRATVPIHCATGLPVNQQVAVAAAVFRARKRHG